VFLGRETSAERVGEVRSFLATQGITEPPLRPHVVSDEARRTSGRIKRGSSAPTCKCLREESPGPGHENDVDRQREGSQEAKSTARSPLTYWGLWSACGVANSPLSKPATCAICASAVLFGIRLITFPVDASELSPRSSCMANRALRALLAEHGRENCLPTRGARPSDPVRARSVVSDG
jgi:hypothetical protein